MWFLSPPPQYWGAGNHIYFGRQKRISQRIWHIELLWKRSYQFLCTVLQLKVPHPEDIQGSTDSPITFWTLQPDAYVQLNCEHSPSNDTKLLLLNPCKWCLGTKPAGVAMKFEICITETEMSEMSEVLAALRISVHSSHWMQRRRTEWRDAYKHFVTSTAHASCNSHPRNKMQVDMNMWKILHILIPEIWYNIKWLRLIYWPHCIETNVPLFTIVNILYTNWLCTQ